MISISAVQELDRRAGLSPAVLGVGLLVEDGLLGAERNWRELAPSTRRDSGVTVAIRRMAGEVERN